MPELPEVETVARQLSPKLCGQKIFSSKIYDSRLGNGFGALRNHYIVSVFRLGKQIVIACGKDGPKSSDNKNLKFLAVHLRMTGRLIWHQDRKSNISEKSLRCAFGLSDGFLAFYDTRRFGTMRVSNTLESFEPKGVEPFSKEFTPELLGSMINNSKQAIKQWLLRQDRIVGLGNIYVSEILFAAKIHPDTIVSSLDLKAIKRIHSQTLRILSKAIDNCGTTFSDFQDSTGSIGSYAAYLKVYGRQGQSCKRCKSAEIIRFSQAGRSTFFCPKCQIV